MDDPNHLLELIQKGQQRPHDMELQDTVLKQCCSFLYLLPEERHWFCDKTISRISVYAYMSLVGSFEDSSNVTVVQTFQARIRSMLNECPNCIRQFHKERAQLAEDFVILRGIGFDQITELVNHVLEWEGKLLLERYQTIGEYQMLVSDTQNPQTVKPSRYMLNFLTECLSCPSLLRLNNSLLEAFEYQLQVCYNRCPAELPITRLSPGTLFLMFSASHNLAIASLFSSVTSTNGPLLSAEKDSLTLDKLLNESDFDVTVTEEFYTILARLQNPAKFSWKFSRLFWINCSCLLLCTEQDVFLKKLNDIPIFQFQEKTVDFKLLPIMHLFKNHLFSATDELPFTLRFLSLVFRKYGEMSWVLLKEDFRKVLDYILGKPHYADYLRTISKVNYVNSSKELIESCSSPIPLFSDLTDWIVEGYNCISKESQKSVFATYIFNFMVEQMSNVTHSPVLLAIAFRLSSSFLSISSKSNSLMALMARQEFRSLVEKKIYTVLESIKVPSVKLSSMELISHCLKLDILGLISFKNMLAKKDTTLIFEFSSDLLLLMEKRIEANDIESASFVFSGLADITLLAPFNIGLLAKKTKSTIKDEAGMSKLKELVSASNKYNKSANTMEVAVDKVFARVAESFTNTHIKQVMSLRSPATGIWSAFLSPEEKVYQAAVGLLYEAFDVQGRNEAIYESLKWDRDTTLYCISLIVDSKFPITSEFLNGCRIVTVLMDVSKSLFDPIHGLVVKSSSTETEESMNILLKMYCGSWKFLKSVYENTFKWSLEYEGDKPFLTDEQAEVRHVKLREFTRDALDLSHIFLNGFTIIIDHLVKNGKDRNALEKEVLKIIVESLTHMIGWLRLSDLALLVSCVDLIIRTLDLGLKLAYNDLPESTLVTLTKLCIKAKSHNNKLNEQQRGEILIRARKINEEKVEQIIKESEDLKAAKLKAASRSVTPEVEIYDLEKMDEPMPLSKSGTRSQTPTSKSLTQKTLTDFYKIADSVSEAFKSTPQSTAPKRTSALEIARMKLAERRSNTPTAPAPIIHPARAPGFNKKKTVESDSESEDESDGESRGLLFVSEEERERRLQKIRLNLNKQKSHVRVNYNGATKITAVKPAMDMKKKAEELMRLRLNVDMNPLYAEVLSWDYNRASEFPSDDSKIYTKIKDTFNDPQDYKNTLKPLLLLECWQAIQRAKEISQETPFKIVLGSRTATDSFYELYGSVEKEIVTEKRLFGESDLVALMCIKGLDDSMVPTKGQMKDCTLTCLAKVKEIKYSNSQCDITFKININSKLSPHLVASSSLVGVKVMQMTTIEREFSSLAALQYYDLSNEVIKGIPRAPINMQQEGEEHVKQIEKSFNVNQSQAVAIAGTVLGEGFSLIQGPPGTGKTKTILGIIGYILTSPNLSQAKATVIQAVDKAPVNKRKILICAPSNAAVDELVLRLRSGVLDHKGVEFKPNVIRLGRSDAINEAVRDLTLEELVENKLQSIKTNYDAINKLKQQLTELSGKKEEISKKLSDPSLKEKEREELAVALQDIYQKRKELGKTLDKERDEQQVKTRNKEIEKRRMQFKLLTEAQIVCSTLSGSAHDVLANMSLTFDTVVIDEAAQCIELSALIPLRYGCKKCIMVGDPNQLPPTVLSQKAASYSYEQSLFVRMQNLHKNSVYLLDIQYRMHPDISRFPSKEFYDSRLIDGPNMDQLTTREWHNTKTFKPYLYYNLSSKHSQNSRTKSYYNMSEAHFIIKLVDDLFTRYQDVNWASKIGIISPYKEQVRTIRNKLIEAYGQNITREIDLNTVDGFQGQEKEVIIFSCVRASEDSSSIGFVADIRRMNVALTRAKCSLWIVGNKQNLTNNRTWKDLIDDAYSRNLAIDAGSNYSTMLNNISSSKVVKSRDKEKKEKKQSDKKKFKNGKAAEKQSAHNEPEDNDEDEKKSISSIDDLANDDDDYDPSNLFSVTEEMESVKVNKKSKNDKNISTSIKSDGSSSESSDDEDIRQIIQKKPVPPTEPPKASKSGVLQKATTGSTTVPFASKKLSSLSYSSISGKKRAGESRGDEGMNKRRGVPAGPKGHIARSNPTKNLSKAQSNTNMGSSGNLPQRPPVKSSASSSNTSKRPESAPANNENKLYNGKNLNGPSKVPAANEMFKISKKPTFNKAKLPPRK